MSKSSFFSSFSLAIKSSPLKFVRSLIFIIKSSILLDCFPSKNYYRETVQDISHVATDHKFGFHRQFKSHQAQNLFGKIFRNTTQLKNDFAALDYRDPMVKISLALAHAGFRRLLGD